MFPNQLNFCQKFLIYRNFTTQFLLYAWAMHEHEHERRLLYFASLSLLISLVVCFSISRRMSLIESTKSTPCSPVCVAGPDGCGCERQPGGGGQDSEQPARLPGQPALHSKWSSGKWQKGANNSIISLVQFKIFLYLHLAPHPYTVLLDQDETQIQLPDNFFYFFIIIILNYTGYTADDVQQEKTRIPYRCNPTLPYPTVVVIRPSKTPLLLSSKPPGLLLVVVIQPSRTCPCCCHPTIPDSPVVVLQPSRTPLLLSSNPSGLTPVVVIQPSQTPMLLSSNNPGLPCCCHLTLPEPQLLLSNYPGLPCCCYLTIPDSPVVVI